MDLRFKPVYLVSILIALILIAADIWFFLESRWFWSFLILSISFGWLHFWIDFFREVKRQREIEEKFLDFLRIVVSVVKSGATITQAIKQSSRENLGALNPYIHKMVAQIEWGISIIHVLRTFSYDTKNKAILRAVSILIESEESGGEIGDVLEAVASSVVIVKKMKEEQKSESFSQMVQGYIVFVIFIGIMLMLQLKLFPQLSGVGAGSSSGLAILGGGTEAQTPFNLDKIFFSLLLIQGFFAGLVVGKFSEGSLKKGILHSLIMMTLGALILTTVKGGI